MIEIINLKQKSNYFTLIETRKSRDIQSDNDYEEKIPYMHTYRFIKVTRYHEGTNEKSADTRGVKKENL